MAPRTLSATMREAPTGKQVTLCQKGEPGKQVTLCPPQVAATLTTAKYLSARGAGGLDTGKLAIQLNDMATRASSIN